MAEAPDDLERLAAAWHERLRDAPRRLEGFEAQQVAFRDGLAKLWAAHGHETDPKSLIQAIWQQPMEPDPTAWVDERVREIL